MLVYVILSKMSSTKLDSTALFLYKIRFFIGLFIDKITYKFNLQIKFFTSTVKLRTIEKGVRYEMVS